MRFAWHRQLRARSADDDGAARGTARDTDDDDVREREIADEKKFLDFIRARD